HYTRPSSPTRRSSDLEAKNALAVPSEAITNDETGRPIVYTLDNGKWQAAVVQTGITDGKYTEIKQGLTAGQTIRVTPSLIQASRSEEHTSELQSLRHL